MLKRISALVASLVILSNLGIVSSMAAQQYTFKGSAIIHYGENLDGSPVNPISSASDCYISGLVQQSFGFIPKETSWVALSSTRGGEVNILNSKGEVVGVGNTKASVIDELTCAVTFSVKVPKSNFYKIKFLDGNDQTQQSYTFRKSIPFSVVTQKKVYKFDTNY
jgi:hypothetical protein